MQSPSSGTTGSGSAQQTLPSDARVNLVKEREATGIDEVFESLDADLVGLTPVGSRVFTDHLNTSC